MNILHAGDDAVSALYRAGWTCPAEVSEGVARILADVRVRRDQALVEYCRRFDDPGFDLSKLRVPIPMHEQARNLVPHEIVKALALARERVEAFHRRQVHPEIAYTDDDGTRYAFLSRPLGAVAAYVPGGTAALPTSVIMSVVPAKLAGVPRIVVLTPPQKDGRIAPAVLFACWLCDVDELYALGGAQAIAAAAYGTQTIARVDKIVGPGNAWVTEAKRQVFGACAIDGLAGPSEVLVVADEHARPDYIVADLLAQAEHDEMATVAVVSESMAILEACAAALEAIDVSSLPRGRVIAPVLAERTFLIHAKSRRQLLDVVERFAPEHLSLQIRDPHELIPVLRNVGAVFAGETTPVASGDYLAGTNHVLPTSGAARFSSGLRVDDFIRTFSFVENSSERMRSDARPLRELALFEGLPAHAFSAELRVSEERV